MNFRYCDELGDDGFGWIADETMTRTSHAVAVDGKVWLVDPVDWPDAVDRARETGEPAGVIQLLDRHNRDCAALAERLAVRHLRVPDTVPDSPFECIALKRSRQWSETALWWPATRTLLVSEALGTNPFFAGAAPLGVHPLLRLTPPRALGAFEPEHLLVGHGEGVHGPGAADTLREALRTSRRGLPELLVRLPFAGRG